MALESWTKSNSFQQDSAFTRLCSPRPSTRLRHAWRLNYQGRHTVLPKPCLNRSKRVAQACFHRNATARQRPGMSLSCVVSISMQAHGSKGTRMAEAWTLRAPFAYAEYD